MKRKNKTNFLVLGGLIAAIYAVATYFSAAMGLAYGGIQFRISEALTILPIFTPAAIPGLIIGCFIGNMGSPFGLVDILLGTFATAFAALCTYLTQKITFKKIPLLAFTFPVIFNAIIVGTEVAWFLPEGFSLAGFFISAMQVAVGELVICFGLGIPLYLLIKKYENKLF